MKTYSKLFISGALIAMSLTSCFNDNKEEIYSNQPATCDTASVSYSSDIDAIMTGNCTSGCHSGSAPAAGLDLTNYNDVKASSTGILNRINGRGALMPQGGPALADCDILKIETWVADGAPNN